MSHSYHDEAKLQIGDRFLLRSALTGCHNDIDSLYPILQFLFFPDPSLHRLLQDPRGQTSMIRLRPHPSLSKYFGNPITRILSPRVDDTADGNPRREGVGRIG